MLKKFLISIKLLPRKGKKFYCLIKSITGFAPSNIELYKLAFQHKSLMRKCKEGVPLNNERLEYLGDAILSAVIAHELFIRFPDKDEGELTKIRSRIVNRFNLNRLAMEMGLNSLIKTQPLADLSQTHIPGDALEAFIGAIYLDKGYQKATKFILKHILNDQSDLAAFVENDTNYKSTLIEWGQKNKCEIHFITEEYPEQQPSSDIHFVAQAFVNKQIMGTGKGTSKKEAQQNAACKALKNVETVKELSLN